MLFLYQEALKNSMSETKGSREVLDDINFLIFDHSE